MRRHALESLAIALFAASIALAAAARAEAPPPDWAAIAGADPITISVPERDGTPRERTIWLVVVDGQGYVRAGGSSRWDDAIDADPDVAIRVEGVSYDLRATRVPPGEQYERVKRAFREKYGRSDLLIGFFRGLGGAPRILRLEPRPGAAGS